MRLMTSKTKTTLLIGLFLFLISSACSDSDGVDVGDPTDYGPPYSTRVILRNFAQSELLEIRAHDGADYTNAPNRLSVPLAVDEAVGLVWVNGSYLTVIRRKLGIGDKIALTTALSLTFWDEGYIIEIFDDGIRTNTGIDARLFWDENIDTVEWLSEAETY
ncbi:hypothetical protein KAI87_09725 [Myxococcota bacterium]|nr:hypothetical protein [Myxococcota bacterium]